MTEPKKKILKGDEAIELWKKGKDVWNRWVEENPVADVIFKDVNFGTLSGNGLVQFAGYSFPTGKVNFFKAHFGGGDVNFSKAHLDAGDVNFRKAQFGVGHVSFNQAHFGEGSVFFNEAQFGKGNIDFFKTHFGEGNVYFSGAHFGEGGVSFANVRFLGNADFSSLEKCDEVTSFSFKNVSFEKTFSLSGDFGCVVDLVGTKTSHHVELSGLTCHLPRNKFWRFPTTAKNKEDASRLLRLKELAEQNKHHEAALKFHADEMRAKRWRETSIPASCLDILFSAVSNYGQSIWRPVVGLGVLIILSSFAAEGSAKAGEIMVSWGVDKVALKTAIQNSLPFLPASRSTSSLLSTLHQLGAFVFIFLIGLGLRNRFRV